MKLDDAINTVYPIWVTPILKAMKWQISLLIKAPPFFSTMAPFRSKCFWAYRTTPLPFLTPPFDTYGGVKLHKI